MIQNKLGIIAGGGLLPKMAIKACQEAHRPFYVLALKDFALPEIAPGVSDSYQLDWIRIGQAGRGLKKLRQHQVKQAVMIGSVKRPTLSDLFPDWMTLCFFLRLGIKALGDDGFLRAVIKEFEGNGISVIGIQDVLHDCLAPLGIYGRVRPDELALADVNYGFKVAELLGTLDIGQSVIVQQGIVLGVEAIEGTDHLIERCKVYHHKGKGGVLVKACKQKQDRRVDLPTIGVQTIENAVQNGLRGIALQAERSLIIDLPKVIETADKLGIFVMGIK